MSGYGVGIMNGIVRVGFAMGGTANGIWSINKSQGRKLAVEGSEESKKPKDSDPKHAQGGDVTADKSSLDANSNIVQVCGKNENEEKMV